MSDLSSRSTTPIEIYARRKEAEFAVPPNRRTRIHVPHFLDRVWWEGVGHPRGVAPGGRLALCVRGVGFGHGSGVDVTVRDSGGTFRGSRRVTLHRGHRALAVRVPRRAEGLLIATVAIPRRDRPRWRAGLRAEALAQVLPAVSIVRTRLREVRFGDDVASDGASVRITAQADPAAAGRAASVELGRAVPLPGDPDGRSIWTPVDGPHPTTVTDRGDIVIDWVVNTADIDRSRIWSQEAIERGRSDASASGAVYRGPASYRGIDLVARVRVLGLRSDSTDAAPAGPHSTGTLAVRDRLGLRMTDADTGAPYAGQELTLALADGTSRTVTLDGDGRATADNLPPGPTRLHVDAFGVPEAPADDASERPASGGEPSAAEEPREPPADESPADESPERILLDAGPHAAADLVTGRHHDLRVVRRRPSMSS